MSPNGRRAWRKWVLRQDLRRKHKQPKGSICRMARQARRHIPLVPGVVPPKPFTTRSLVGMTMGARKRAAYYEALRSSYDGDGGPISNRKLRLCLRTALLTPEVLSDSVPLDYRLDVRAKYRIGKRLRPCPGCFDCAVECWVCHEPHEPEDELCGGSGVIRAGKLRPQLRSPACGFYIE